MPRKRPAEKPYKDFPLFLHATGQWAKKIRGRTHYFGADTDAALNKYLAERDDLQAGRVPKPDGATGPTLRDLSNRFLTFKRGLVDSGELSPRTWGHYYLTVENLLAEFGKTRRVANLTTEDFEKYRAKLAKTRRAHALAGEIQRVRTLFKFAFDRDIIDKPVRLDAAFKKPSKLVMRKARHETGPRMFEAKELKKLLRAADQPLRAMILLGINCGFGQSDVANLPRSALDLKCGWVNFPRPKTGISRRCPLWPETVKALREAIPKQPCAKSPADAGMTFITKYGNRWVRVRAREGKPGVPIDAVQIEFVKLLTALNIKRRGIGFYALRHTFRTIADTAKDQPAANLIMGHVDDSMADLYRERIDDVRLKAVAEVVRQWLQANPTSLTRTQ